MRARLVSGALLIGLVVPAFAQSTGPLAVEERGIARDRAAAPAADPAGVMVLMEQLQMYEQELASLRSQVEELRRDLEVMRQAERERFLDLDTRINALASAGVEQGKDPSSPPPGAGQEADREAYMVARQKLGAQDFAGAAQAFESYLAEHPKGQFRDFAHFWLGEVYRSLGRPDRDRAMRHFRAVVEKHPESSKVSSALYKLAVLEYESGNVAAAKATLDKVIRGFPESSEAALARSLLAQIK